MSLPVHYAKLDDVILDDLKFQKLVDEGRKRIRQYCPEWTEYNVSDPGVTLIELFAWMTELLAYRFNQVPYKHYIKFLEMLGYGLQPAQAATTDLTFRLAAPFPVDLTRRQSELWTKIERGFQVSTGQTTGEPIIFTVERPLEIRTPAIQWLCNPLDFTRNYWRLTAAGQLQDEFSVFRPGKPQHNDLFYIGFAEPEPLPNRSSGPTTPPATNAATRSRLAGHVLRLTIQCKQTPPVKVTTDETEEDQPKQTAGHRLNQPPLLWEYCDADLSTTAQSSNNAWRPITIGSEGEDRDTTGGLYYETGTLTLFLPLDLRPRKLNGIAAVWIRCRYHQGLHSADNVYTQSPILEGVQVQTIGATTTASNMVIVAKKDPTKGQEKQEYVSDAGLAEELGTSNGEPGQCFKLKNFPILEPMVSEDEEKIFVEHEPRSGRYEPWDYCETFAESDKHSKQVLLNRNTGEVHFGPNIRQPDGKSRQYGRVPPVGCRIFIKGYRYHAGANGNLPAHYLRVMHQSAPYVDWVTNHLPVENGRDAERVEEAIMRAQRSLRAQERAVSAVDFETLTPRKVTDYSQNSPKEVVIARVKCLTPDDFIGYTPASTEQQPVVAAGTVDLLLVPEIKKPAQLASWFELELSPSVRECVRSHLQNYCLLARSVRVRKPLYHAIKVTLVAKSYFSKDFGKERLLIDRIERFLYRYFSPLPYGFDINEKKEKRIDDLPSVVRNERWKGWNFGEPLTELRLRSLLQEIEGVKYVDKLEVQSADLQTLDPEKIKAENPGVNPEDAIKKQIKLQKLDFAKPTPADLLYCSFEHDVKIEW